MPTIQFTEGAGPPKPLSARKQLLNHIVDGMAQTRPQSVWAKVPRDEHYYARGYRKITYKLMANAINGIAAWLTELFGRSTTFETLAYFGSWDPRYIIIMLGAVKAGYKMIFPSSLYPINGLTALLDQLGCRIILASMTTIPIVSNLVKDGKRVAREVPSLNTLLGTKYAHFPFDKTFEAARSEPLVVVHTSETTGTPKPLIWTHDWVASFIRHNQLVPPLGYISLELPVHGIEVCSVAPPNQSSSFIPNLFYAVPNEMVVLFPVSNAPITLGTTLEMIKHNDPSMLIAPAHVLVGIAKDPEALEQVASKVSMIGYYGGPLLQQAGDILTKRFRLVGMYGTSEIGLVHKIAPEGIWDGRCWNSTMPHPEDGVEFRHRYDDCYEAVVVKSADAENTQAAFKLYPALDEWGTKHLFSPDPHRAGSWVYKGRLDDVLVLGGGSTVNPTGYEHRLMSAPSVAFAVMCGMGKRWPALVVELAPIAPPTTQAQVEEAVHALVEECNGLFPPQASISKERIIFTSADRPLPVSAKGTVQRAAALQLYQTDIDALYV